MRPEVEELLDVPIKHPSLATHGDHESWLVTSGNLADVVRVEIHDRNERRVRDGKRPLRVKVGGELIAAFVGAHERYFPADPPALKRFLELYMADGRAELPKSESAAFLVSTLPYSDLALSMRARGQAVSSAILLASYVAEPYRKTSNQWAVAETWLVTAAHILALIDSTGADPRDWAQPLLLVEAAIERAVGQLTREVVEKQEHLFEDGLFDPPTYRFRTTVLAGWLARGLLYKLLKNEAGWRDEAVLELIERRLLPLILWGEGAVPPFLNLMWCYGAFTRTALRDVVLETVLRTRVQALGRTDEGGLLNPYYGLDFGVRLATKSLRDPIFESFSGSSYMLETLVTLVARLVCAMPLHPSGVGSRTRSSTSSSPAHCGKPTCGAASMESCGAVFQPRPRVGLLFARRLEDRRTNRCRQGCLFTRS